MNWLKRLQAAQLVKRLRRAEVPSPETLRPTQDRLIALGSAAVEPVMECLAHGVARGPAQVVLDSLLDCDSLPRYMEAMGSRNPAVASGVAKVLARNANYDPARLLDLIEDPSVSRPNLEEVLIAQSKRLRSRDVLARVAEVGSEGRVLVLRVLEKIADLGLVPDLVRMLENPDWWVRLYMCRLLSDLKSTGSAEAIAGLLRDTHREVRLQAVKSLGALEARDVMPKLVDALRDEDLKVQTEAIDTVTRLGDAGTVPLLLEVLSDESEHARRAAVEVLNEIATAEAIQDLVRSMRDADWWVRVRAADALGTLGGEKVVQAVVGLLKDPDNFMRRYAVEILNTVPSHQSVEPLIEALEDEDWWVCERSIDALGASGDSRAVEPLRRLMQTNEQAAPLCEKALAALEASTVSGETDSGKVPSRRDLLGVEAQTKPSPLPAAAPPVFPSLTPVPPVEPAEPAAAGGSAGEAAPSSETRIRTVNFHNLPPGTVLQDRFKVIRKVGKGGFGAVYLVTDAAIEEEIILKVLNPQLSADETSVRRFVQELKLSRKITHRNVIRIFDFLDLDGAHAVSMEFFPGRDLSKVIRRGKSMEIGRVLRIARQIADGLEAVHEAGVVHRDIKPANVLVNPDDQVKIVDFGLASASQQAGSRLTASGLLIGTPEYIAPEQINGEAVDQTADIYALGVILYEMVTGNQPFTAETPVKTLFKHLEGGAPPVDTVVEGVDPRVKSLIERAMAREKQDRFPDASALRDAIRSILKTLPEGTGESHGENRRVS